MTEKENREKQAINNLTKFHKDKMQVFGVNLDNDLEIVLNLLEKQGKMIDEMANKLVEAHGWFYSEFDNYTKEDFKQYFENKVNSSEQN